MAKDKLETRRVYLRALTDNDASPLYAEVTASRDLLKRRLRWVGGVQSEQECRVFIEACEKDATVKVWGIFEHKEDRLVGVAAFQGMGDDKRAQAEIGFWIAVDRQDKGLGSEVGRVMIDYAFRKLNRHRLQARIDPANRSFRKVLKKIGFRYEGCLRCDQRLNGRWIDQECWGMLKSEWKK
ncbi:MAG: hypothetical protein COB53_13010 [Elusimicrobia bacterium]|nr:MAG: hypothetical protein COB53_13010 [Elusimicrobiota bacterium]